MENKDKTDTTQTARAGLTVRYNHADRELTDDQAREFAQKGMKYDSIRPMLDGIAYLAKVKGMSREDMVKALIREHEAGIEKDFLEKYGDEEIVKALMDRYRSENAFTDEQAEAEHDRLKRLNLEERLAEEFDELKSVFGDITFKEIPDEVIRAAANEKLLNAYLLHREKEKQKIAKAEKLNKRNQSAALGDMAPGGEAEDNLLSAFIKGLKNKN